MAEGRGTVVRLVFSETGAPFCESRTRDSQALFGGVEWGWSRDPDDAYLFAQYSPCQPEPDGNRSACDHVAMLMGQGEGHAHPTVYGRDAEAAAKKRQGERKEAATRAAGFLPAHSHVSPEESAALLEKRGLF